jgi:hypothetical protein
MLLKGIYLFSSIFRFDKRRKKEEKLFLALATNTISVFPPLRTHWRSAQKKMFSYILRGKGAAIAT